MDEYLNSLLYFLGYGNPIEAKIYAFGIEEKLTSPDEPESKRRVYIDKHNNLHRSYTLVNEDIYESCPGLEMELRKAADNSQFYTRITQICNKLLLEEEKVTNQELGSLKSKVFISNYSFIARESTKEARKSPEEKFYQENLSKRKKILKQFFDEIINKKDNILLTFGIMKEFKKLFGDEYKFDDITFRNPSNGRGKFYSKAKNANIFLFYHSSHNWLSEQQVKNLNLQESIL